MTVGATPVPPPVATPRIRAPTPSQKAFRVVGFKQPVHGVGEIELRLDLGHHRLDQQHVGFHSVFLEFCAEACINR
jgi:hypothetical protein